MIPEDFVNAYWDAIVRKSEQQMENSNKTTFTREEWDNLLKQRDQLSHRCDELQDNADNLQAKIKSGVSAKIWALGIVVFVTAAVHFAVHAQWALEAACICFAAYFAIFTAIRIAETVL